MKRLIVAGLLLVFIGVAYLTSLKYITKSCEKTKQLLETSITAYSKEGTAESKVKKIKEFWDKKEKVLSVFVNHNRIDDIEKSISSLSIYAKEKNNILFYEYADEIKILLHQMLEDTKVSMHSVM